MENSGGDGHVFFTIKESRAHFARGRREDGRAVGHGQFFLQLHVIALQGAVYIPLSIASGKKPTGFVYQIEGTSEGAIATAEVACKGAGITQVTLGTLVYAKVQQGSTADFRIVVNIKGKVNKEFRVVINRINYKLDPSDARYKKLDAEIATKALEFK